MLLAITALAVFTFTAAAQDKPSVTGRNSGTRGNRQRTHSGNRDCEGENGNQYRYQNAKLSHFA